MKENAPVERFNAGLVSASVWKNTASNGTTFYAVSLGKRYRERESGEWKNAQSFGADDIQRLKQVIAEAEKYIEQQREEVVEEMIA